MAVAAKLLSCACCEKKGCDGEGAVSPEGEGGTSASQLAFDWAVLRGSICPF